MNGASLPASSDLTLAKRVLAGDPALWEADAAERLRHPDWPGRLEIVRTLAGLEALRPVWDELVESSATRSVFMRWDWVRLWWELYGAEYELAVIVARDGFGVVEGIAPLVVGRAASGARRYLRQLCWLGGVGEVEGEVMDFLVPAGREAELTPRLCQGLRLLGGDWQGVRLNKIPGDSPNLPILLEELKAFTVFAGVVNIHDSRCTVLPGDWEAYAARHSGRWRRNLRKRWEALTLERGARPFRAGADWPVADAMAQLGTLHEERWQEGGSSFRKQQAWEFHRRLAELWVPEGRAVLTLLAVGGRVIAGCYGFLEGDRFYHYQIGWDRQYAELSLGNLAVRQCLTFCLERGVLHYEMLSGEYRYKSEWCPEARSLIDVEGYASGSPAAACFVGLRSLKRMVLPSAAAGPGVDVAEG